MKNWHVNFLLASNRSRIVVLSQSNRTHIVISITSVVVECVVVSSYRSRVVVESQLWYRLSIRVDPTTTYRARLLPFDAIRREQKLNMSIFRRSRVVVVSQSNRTQIVISITSVVVECIVVSSYCSRIAIVITALTNWWSLSSKAVDFTADSLGEVLHAQTE